MAKYCIFRIYRKKVHFFESFEDWGICNKRLDMLTELAIMHDIDVRYIMRKLEDYEDPETYSPYPKFIVVYPHKRNHFHK